MSTSDDPLALLRSVGAVLEGHFQYTSGRHGPLYVEKFRLLEDPVATGRLCGQIADHFRAQQVELVVGPTTGGILLAYEVARLLGVHSYFAERGESGEGRVFQRQFTFQPGQRTLVVDDVLTTGGSIRETLAAVRAGGGEPLGVGVIVDRSGGRTDFRLPLFGCMTLDLQTYTPEECPLCQAGQPPIET